MNDLSGSIPDCIGELPALDYLDMSNNKLVGCLPSSISKLTALKELKLHYNQLSGTIPSEISHLTSLRGLHLESNAFTGQIPVAMCSMISLTKLNLGLSQLSGCIPPEIVTLVNIQELKLNNNNLTGEIPKNLSRLTNLKMLCLNDNKLEGTIPEELGTMTSLKKLHLNNNRLTGKLPLTFRTSTLQSLKVEGNNLTGPLTIQELNKTSKEVKIAISVSGVLLAVLLYWMIPLVLPFAGGICLHNHVQFQYPTSASLAAKSGGLFSQSLYRRPAAAPAVAPIADALNDETVECSVPSYCKSLYLNMAFPFIMHRTITLSEVEVTALFRSLYHCESSSGSSGGAATTQVGLHVVTVTRDIAQSIADALEASTEHGCSSSLSLIYINALETVLPLPAKAILLDAVQAVEKVRPLKIFYNRNDIAAEKVVMLHIQGMGYILRYIFEAKPFASLRLALGDWWAGLGQSSNNRNYVIEPAEVSVDPAVDTAKQPSLFQRVFDLLECSLQFDLTNHPKCVSGRGDQPQAHSRSVGGADGNKLGNLENFLATQCALSAKLAHQLFKELGVELVSDLTLLHPSDLDSLHLPAIPRRKLQLCVCDTERIPLEEKERSLSHRPLCQQTE